MTSPPAPLRNTEALSTCRVGEEAARPGGFCDKANQRRARQLSLFGPEGAEHEASPVAVLELPYPGIARVNDPISKAPAQPQSAQQDCLRPSIGPKPCRHHGMTAASAFDEAPTTAANDQTGSRGETCCPAVLSEMVRTSSHAEAGIDAAVILEAPATRLPWVTRRNMTARALICLEGGDLWLAELKGHPWSAERLGQLADVIRTPVKFRADKRTLEQRAEDALQLPGVVVRRPSLDDMDARAWSTRPIAVALLLAHAVSSSTQVDSADVQELTGVLDTALRAALATLKRALDPQALGLAVHHPEIAAELYSYLSEAARRRYRLQFATTFPLLLPAVLAVDASSPFHPIRAAVDAGDRAVQVGASALGVSPSTMRCLIGQSLEAVGSRWVATPLTLIRLLDSLRPEARPGRGDHTWENLNSLVRCCEEATGRRVDDSFFVRAWIREQLHRAGTRAASASVPDFAAREVAAVDLFRQELLAVLVVESCSARASTRGIAQAIATHVDRELQQFTLKTLLRLARDWQERLDQERLADRSLVEFVRSRGERYWPLLQRPHASEDRSRLVVPLATAEQLVAHGQALGICLASDLVHSYISACRKGRIFILGICDLDTGRPLSTAELRLTRKADTGPIAAVVVQHTSASNATPSGRCRTALSEALRLVHSDPGQAHLRVGLAALRTFCEPAAASLSRVEAQASVRAFKTVMGDARVDTMLQGARHVAGVVGSARPRA